MLAKRIVPCLDVRDGAVVKGVKFDNHRVVGDPAELAKRYADELADELVFYDITASPQGRSVDTSWISRIAKLIDIPFCVAGGIDSVEAARAILSSGAEKVSVNTPALRNPKLITELSKEFGSQSVVVGIDVPASGSPMAFAGDPNATQSSERDLMDWVVEVQERGAGEIVFNSMPADGTKDGYDVERLKQVRDVCSVPLIASGGAGSMQHFADVFANADVDAALAATVFHDRVFGVGELKKFLVDEGVEIRC